MSASTKTLLSTLTQRGPHRVLRGDLAVTGQPGVVYTPVTGRELPAVAFGHGWLTGVDHYRGLLEHLASWGIVAAAPDTERGPMPSHLDLATDLDTVLDICAGVRLGDGSVSVHPDRLALAGHAMGAGAAVLAARHRQVAAVAALFPSPTAPAAEDAAAELVLPGLVLAGSADLAAVSSNAAELAAAWGGPVVFRSLKGATSSGLPEGRRLLSALGGGKPEHKTMRMTRALLTGYLLATVAGDKDYAAFADPNTTIKHTQPIDPHAHEDEQEPSKPGVRQLIGALRG